MSGTVLVNVIPSTSLRFVKRRGVLEAQKGDGSLPRSAMILQQMFVHVLASTGQVVRHEWRDVPVEDETMGEAANDATQDVPIKLAMP